MSKNKTTELVVAVMLALFGIILILIFIIFSMKMEQNQSPNYYEETIPRVKGPRRTTKHTSNSFFFNLYDNRFNCGDWSFNRII